MWGFGYGIKCLEGGMGNGSHVEVCEDLEDWALFVLSSLCCGRQDGVFVCCCFCHHEDSLTAWVCDWLLLFDWRPRLLMEQELGAGSREKEEVTTSLASTSASSSNSDLPSTPLPEGERVSLGRRHSSRTFTGLRLFGRRWVKRNINVSDELGAQKAHVCLCVGSCVCILHTALWSCFHSKFPSWNWALFFVFAITANHVTNTMRAVQPRVQCVLSAY